MHSVKGKGVFEQLSEGQTQVTFEQHANSGGNIPAWLANSAVTDVPYNSLNNFRNLFKE
jgi:hypothetical protein